MHRFLRSVLQMVLVGLGPLLLAVALSLLPSPSPVQASGQAPLPATRLQSRTAVTIYLPLIQHWPTPEEQLLELINAERQRRGTAALSFDATLLQVAEAHSQDMVSRDFFSHTNPDGWGPGERLDNAGYNWQTWGETIGAGYATPQAMFTGWMNSSGHRDIMLSASYTEVGIGYVTGGDYGHYWTAVFGRPWP